MENLDELPLLGMALFSWKTTPCPWKSLVSGEESLRAWDLNFIEHDPAQLFGNTDMLLLLCWSWLKYENRFALLNNSAMFSHNKFSC